MLNVRVLALTAGVTTLSSVIFGFLPPFLCARTQIAESLKDEARSTPTGQAKLLRSLLVVAQMSLALVLLVGPGLLIRSFVRLVAVDPGFNPRNLLMFQVGLPRARYAKDEAQMAFFRDLLLRVGRLPERIPCMESFRRLLGREAPRACTLSESLRRAGGPSGLRSTCRGSILFPDHGNSVAGRPLLRSTRVHETSHVVVVNQVSVDKYLRGENPIGKKVSI